MCGDVELFEPTSHADKHENIVNSQSRKYKHYTGLNAAIDGIDTQSWKLTCIEVCHARKTNRDLAEPKF